MNANEFLNDVERIPLKSIKPAPNNPRGEIDRGASFARLVSSIEREGVLVPIVVSSLPAAEGDIKYLLVDGERRFWAAKELGVDDVPTYILPSNYSEERLRELSFHLHMTREQWEPLAQCKSLAAAYPPLENGIRLDDKLEWTQRIATETGMTLQTARDRVNVLAWARPLKKKIYEFDRESPKSRVYSYVLAIEASIIEPSVKVFPDYYNGTRAVDTAANEVRGALLDKTISGIQTRNITGRGQIRNVSALFVKKLSASHKKIARNLFDELVNEPSFKFEDAEAEITARLPEVLQETPKPQRVLARIKTLVATLDNFDPSYIDLAELKDEKKQVLREELRESLEKLAAAVERVREQI